MAAKQTVALEVKTNLEPAAKSVGSLKQQLKEAQNEVVNLSEKFGATSKEAIAAAKNAAKLKDAIGDAKALTDAYNPDAKFKAFGAAIQGVTGGFAALQGVQGLFGDKSEELEKTLLKVQSAMALTQGLNSVMEAKDAFVNLATFIKGGVVQAFNVLKTVMLANPILTIVSVLAGVALSFKKVRDAIINFIPGLKEVIGFFGDLIEKVTDFFGATSDATRAYDKFAESIKRGNEEIDNSIKLLEAAGNKEAEIYNLKAKRIENDLNLLREKFKVEGELSEEEWKQFRDLQADKQVLSIQENKRQEKEREDNQKKIEEDNQKALEKQKAYNEKVKALNDRRREEQRQQLQQVRDLINQINQDIQDRASTEQEREVNRIKRERDARLAIVKGDREAQLTIEEDFFQKLDEINKKYKVEPENIPELKLPAIYKDIADKRIENENAVTQNFLNNTKERIRYSELEAEERTKFAQDIGGALSALSDLIGKETAAGKALSAAQATINTFQGATEVLKAKSVLPEPFGTISKIANVTAIIATGLKSVKSILATKVPGGSSGGSTPSVNVTAPLQPQATTTRLDQTSINQLGNAAAPRAYVVEKDITGSQQRIRQLQRAAKIN